MSNALSPSTRHLRTRHLRAPLAANAAAQPEDVLTAKTLLLRLGYYETPEWGISPYPDAALFKAVRAFQSAQGLAADGIIKPEGETEAALHAAATRLQSLDLQSMGRNGDTLLAHITPAEARLLDTVTDGGSINPQTGLLEFFTTGGFASRGLNASSLGGNAKNKDRDSGGSRQKTYTDAQLAGAAKANEEAAHTREKVRSYLDRSAASANDRVTPRINERANQQAPARTAANTERQRETHRETQAALARGLAAATQGRGQNVGQNAGQNADLSMKQDAGMLSIKSASALTANRYAAPATPAMPSFKQAAHNATPSNAAAPGVDPSWGPSATPAQQAHNIKQTRQFTQQQRDAAARANAANTITRTRVRDYLGIMSQTPTTPRQSPSETRKAAWSEAKNRIRGNLLAEWGVPAPSTLQEPPIPADKISWYNSQPGLKTKRTQFFSALQKAGLSSETINTLVGVLDREGGLMKNANGSAYGGITKNVLESLIYQGRVKGIPLRTEPKDLTPAQAADAYKAYYNDAFYAQDGAATLNKVNDPKAKDLLADALFARGHEKTGAILQSSINAVLGEPKHNDSIIGSGTLTDYDALTRNPKTRNAVLNAIADHFWEQIKNDKYIPNNEKPGWKARIDSLRP